MRLGGQVEKLKEGWRRLGDLIEQADQLLENSLSADSFSQSLSALFLWLKDKVRSSYPFVLFSEITKWFEKLP